MDSTEQTSTSLPEWATAQEIATYLGQSPRNVRRVASEKDWKHRTSNGVRGSVREYWTPDVLGPKLAGPKPSELSNVTDGARQIAYQRHEAVQARDRYRASSPESATLADEEFVAIWNATAQELGRVKVSCRTLRDWARRYKSGGIAGLVDGRQLAGYEAEKLKTIPEELWSCFLRFWLTEHRRAVTTAYDIALGTATDDQEQRTRWREEFSVKLFYRRVKELPEQLVVFAREGRKAWADKCETPLLRDYSSLQSGEVYTSDHRRVDFWAWDPESQKAVRLWCTAWQDVRSRKMLSWSLAAAEPNQERVMLTFARAVQEWGVPDHVHIDNGRDYSSKKFAGKSRRWVKIDESQVTPILASLGIACHFATPYLGRTKVIERTFGLCSERFDKLMLGYCGNRPELRPEDVEQLRKKHPERLPTVDRVHEAFDEFMTWLNSEFHMNGDGMRNRTPDEVWHAHNHTVRFRPRANDLKLLLMPSAIVTPSRGMARVTIAGRPLYYVDNCGYLANVKPGTKVCVRYDPDKLNTAFLFTDQGKYICEVQEHRKLPFEFGSEEVREANRKQASDRKAIRKGLEAERDMRAHPDALEAVVQQRQGYEAQSEGIIESTGTDGPLEHDRDASRTISSGPAGLRLFSDDQSSQVTSDECDSDMATGETDVEERAADDGDWMDWVDRMDTDEETIPEEVDWQEPFLRDEEE